MRPRFFSANPINAPYVELDGPEQHHLTHVLRLQQGAWVTLFDDSGCEYEAEVIELRRDAARLKVAARHEVDRELPFFLGLGVALPKGDRQQWLVEKAAELGVTQLVPLMTERGVAQPRESALGRLERWVVAAAKQCGRNRLMRIARPATMADFFRQARESPVLVAHPTTHATAIRQAVDSLSLEGGPLFLAVGPEGGFTDRDLAESYNADCRTVHLGSRILRVETAAIFLVTSVVYAKT